MSTKVCAGCKREFPEDSFGWKYRDRGVRVSKCRDCVKAYSRAHYLANKQVYIARAKRNNVGNEARKRAQKQRYVDGFGGKCMICGYNRYLGGLDFHHVDPVEKEFEIADLGWLGRSDRVITELKKCILVCRNCHAEIHGGLYSQDFVESLYRNCSFRAG